LHDEYDLVLGGVLTYNTSFVSLPRDGVESFAAEESVRAVASIDPVWRLSPSLDERLRESDPDVEHRVTVVAFDTLDVEGLELSDELRYEGRNDDLFYRGEFTTERIRQLQRTPPVEWLERRVKPQIPPDDTQPGFESERLQGSTTPTGMSHAENVGRPTRCRRTGSRHPPLVQSQLALAETAARQLARSTVERDRGHRRGDGHRYQERPQALPRNNHR
jgi:hypothetical protein